VAEDGRAGCGRPCGYEGKGQPWIPEPGAGYQIRFASSRPQGASGERLILRHDRSWRDSRARQVRGQRERPATRQRAIVRKCSGSGSRGERQFILVDESYAAAGGSAGGFDGDHDVADHQGVLKEEATDGLTALAPVHRLEWNIEIATQTARTAAGEAVDERRGTVGLEIVELRSRTVEVVVVIAQIAAAENLLPAGANQLHALRGS
jgi:hypothetical protein